MSTDVHTLAEQARAMGYVTSEQIINRLHRMIIRNESYLKRRAARGTRTPTDEAISEDSVVAALVIELLQDEPALIPCRSCGGAHYVGQRCPLAPS
jgi:hypothetical protein